MATREQEWEALYDKLRMALAEDGKNDPYGEGDYWIVDDDWGGYHQKVCITNPKFWSLSAEKKISGILYLNHFQIGVCSLCLRSRIQGVDL